MMSTRSSRSRQRFFLTAGSLLAILIVVLYTYATFPSKPYSAGIDDASNLYESSIYRPGKPKPPDYNFTRTLVIAAQTEEDTSWVSESFTDDPYLTTAVYEVDDPAGLYTVPMNKGHEVMVYLTHIIDHYHNLTDITLFMHYHLVTWHNNDLLLSSAIETVKRLRPARIIRHGYMNLRCHHDPGCPSHIDLSTTSDDANIPEAIIMRHSWSQIFPNTSIPSTLSQPCCAQFAVSAERIHALSLEQYVSFRFWLLKTPLEDRLSGRVWEYLWQFVFAGAEELCPEEHVCYCDGYGACMGSKQSYEEYFSTRKHVRMLEAIVNGREYEDDSGEMKAPQEGEYSNEHIQGMRATITTMIQELDLKREAALARGLDAGERERELGEDHSA